MQDVQAEGAPADNPLVEEGTALTTPAPMDTNA